MSHDPTPVPPPGPDEPPAEGTPEHDPPVFPERDGPRRRSPDLPENGVLFEEDRQIG